MFRRLWWIAASYFTRTGILVLFASGMLFGGVTWFIWFAGGMSPVYELAYPQPPAPRLLVDSQAQLDAVRREGWQQVVDAIDLRALWIDMHRAHEKPGVGPPPAVEFSLPGEEFYDILEEFPNLRHVTMTTYGQSAGTRQLGRLAHLEYLAIDGVAPADLGWMRSLGALRWLQLTFYGPIEDARALAELPRVETVIFRSRSEVTDEVLAAMAELARLKQLVLVFPATTARGAAPPFSAAGLAALDRSNSLETLYVGSYMPGESDELLALARRAVSRGRIEPALVVRRSRGMGLTPPLFAMAIGIALASQFRGPMSRLAPGFVASHALVASVFFFAAVLLSVVRLILDGNDPLASSVASLTLAAAGVMLAAAMPHAVSADQTRRKQTDILLRTVLLFVAGSPLILPNLGYEILQGSRPGMVALLGLAGLAAVGFTVHDLRRLAESSGTAGLLDRQSDRRRLLLQSQYKNNWMFASAAREQSIESWHSAPPRWTWWRRVRRWQIGNAPFRSVGMVLMAVVGFYGVTFVMRRLTMGEAGMPGDFGWLRSQSLLVALIMVLMTVGRVAMAWRARLLVLPVESLRPYWRRALRSEMAAAFALDLIAPVLVAAIVGAVGINLDAGLRVDWWRVPADFVIVLLAGLATGAGLGALVAVVKREGAVLALVIVIGLFTAVAVAFLTVVQLTPNQSVRGLTPRVVESQLWLVIAVGLIVAGVMRHRFMQMEIGSRT